MAIKIETKDLWKLVLAKTAIQLAASYGTKRIVRQGLSIIVEQMEDKNPAVRVCLVAAEFFITLSAARVVTNEIETRFDSLMPLANIIIEKAQNNTKQEGEFTEKEGEA